MYCTRCDASLDWLTGHGCPFDQQAIWCFLRAIENIRTNLGSTAGVLPGGPMVEVRMLQQLSGTRPGGGEWPVPGEVIDVSEPEAENLFRNQQAAPLARKGAKRDPGRVREREHDEAVYDAETSQAEANAAHVKAAQVRFAADEAAKAADKIVKDAEDAEADAEELQAKADKAKDAEHRTEPRGEHGPGRGPQRQHPVEGKDGHKAPDRP